MKKFSFVGAGKMASAIVGGMVRSKVVMPWDIECASGADDTGRNLASATGISYTPDIERLGGETFILACKPQQLAEVASKIGQKDIPLLISILAGTTIEKLRARFPNARKIVRVMPNMPALISMGISCYAPESALNKEEDAKVRSVLEAIGEVVECGEARLDAVTALSGSGPGYVFEFASALIAAGEKLGFDYETSKKLTLRTLLGSALLLEKDEREPEVLRDAVCSPGGTTLAALKVFEEAGFRKTVAQALEAAQKRSGELSKL
ncbi:MAG: pyrroline-5-carboxylate reductase [Opitutales bacterium]|nr:pyrroline-5-carboxylate reductase [Opitutales bacterium]